MNILVIGSGGREHALIWALSKSPLSTKIYAAPGNGGISSIAENISISTSDEIINFCKNENIEFVVVGPEAPLVEGLTDELEKANIAVFGPSKAAAKLEASKEFTKYICDKYNIPTAKYESFTDAVKAKQYIDKVGVPIVIKADGLAAGKGVILAYEKQEAIDAIDDILVNNKFGEAGSSVVIEEMLEGEEISVFALSDGKNALYFGSAQDHKAVGEGDTGPNTGGMGTYSPAPIMTNDLQNQIMQETILPAISAMEKEGSPYKGVLFAGFMVTKEGPKLLEFNVRFGDPETQVLMSRLESDLVKLFLATAKGDLSNREVKMDEKAALCVVMAANGYPESYEKGAVINNIDKANKLDDVTIFHAGTKINEAGDFIANGGRVLGVVAKGDNVIQAQEKAYEAVDTIDWPEGFCRRDIGWRAVKREKLAS